VLLEKKEDAQHMVALPSGTVTFLFTDIEGSSRMWERKPQAMAGALARHDDILQSTIEDHGGYGRPAGG
jgi:class 3 adenylate cyclase